MNKGNRNKTSSNAIASRREITKGKGHNKELIITQEVRNKIGKADHRNSSRTTDRRNKTEKADPHKTEIKITITVRQGHKVPDHHKTGIRRRQGRKENKNKRFKGFGLHRNFFYATSFVILKGTTIQI